MSRTEYLQQELTVWEARRRTAGPALRALYFTPEIDAALASHVRELHDLRCEAPTAPTTRRRSAAQPRQAFGPGDHHA